jgi:folate-dependent phosphoribosylglycinamide formyltransferase PurN
MRIGFALTPKYSETAKKIYFSLKAEGFQPDFIVYCFPQQQTIFKFLNFKKFIKNLIIKITPMLILKSLYGNYLPGEISKIYYVKGIISNRALRVFLKEGPSVVVVFGCGIVGKRLCDHFHNVLLNAHAGKLPEYRGVNNVEWAYLEDAPLIGTIHFIVSHIDAGDIVYEQVLRKEEQATSIDEIRKKAFEQVFELFPKAIKRLQQTDFMAIKQNKERTTRYVMHPFLRYILEKRLHSHTK